MSDTMTFPGLRAQGTSMFAGADEQAPSAPDTATTGPLATDKQKAFIRTLLAERDGNDQAEAIREALNAVREAGGLTKAVASDGIKALLEIPRNKVATSGPRRNRHAQACEHCGRTVAEGEGLLGKSDDDTWVVTHEGACPTAFPFPEGRYAVLNAEGEVRFYHAAADGNLYQMASDNESLVYSNARQAIVDKIAADPLEAAKTFGIEFEQCGLCGRGLTSEWRKVGIGPKCAEKVGMA